jgi:uncharacterized protein (UPF0147 family)
MEATPNVGQTVAVQAHSSPKAQSEATQKQLRQILTRLDQSGPVGEARKAMEAAKARIASLRQAQTRLMQTASTLPRNLRAAAASAQNELIEGDGLERALVEPAVEIAGLEAQYRLVLSASERLAEQSLPTAEIDELRRTSDHLLAQAKALRQESAQRIAKTAKMIAEAAQFEGNITFNASETLSGVLVA